MKNVLSHGVKLYFGKILVYNDTNEQFLFYASRDKDDLHRLVTVYCEVWI